METAPRPVSVWGLITDRSLFVLREFCMEIDTADDLAEVRKQWKARDEKNDRNRYNYDWNLSR